MFHCYFKIIKIIFEKVFTFDSLPAKCAPKAEKLCLPIVHMFYAFEFIVDRFSVV